MFQEEAVALLQQYEGTLLWQEGLLQLFRYIEQNREAYLCALKSVGREHLKRFFEADIHAIIHRAVEEVGARALKKRTSSWWTAKGSSAPAAPICRRQKSNSPPNEPI